MIGNTQHNFQDELDKFTNKKLPICVDFDGTLVSHKYPKIGIENKPCVEVLKKWQANGVGIILDTMRDGKLLNEAIKWCEVHGIKLYGVGGTPDQKNWTTSGKAYGVFSVDDRNLGCPLKVIHGERPMVDWEEIDRLYSDAVLELAKSYKK